MSSPGRDARFEQAGRRVRFDWGAEGLAHLAPAADSVVIVDVLRFSTCVDVAVSRGAVVVPYPWRDPAAAAFAVAQRAELAGLREDPSMPWSLSPTDLLEIPPGTRLVLPSPNGAALAYAARNQGVTVFAGCLRNASAVAAVALGAGDRVAVIAAGERWSGHDGVLRPAVEDLIGAGAVIAAARGLLGDPAALSVEATAAAGAFGEVCHDLTSSLLACASGQELAAHGWTDDVETASVHDISGCAPVLRRGAFVSE